MKEKKTRNKFRDSFADYYTTNRKIGEEMPTQKGGPWVNREKIMLAVAVILVVALIVKYAIF